MAIRRNRSKSSDKNNLFSDKQNAKKQSRNKLRQHLLESLEARHLMAAGPQLIGIQPNNSELLNNGDVRNVAPRELVFRFDDSQVIDANSLAGIKITRSGGDGSFGLASVSSDFGTVGKVNVQLTSKQLGNSMTMQVTRANLGNGVAPTVSVSGNTVSVTLNSNATTPTTATQLVTAINGSAAVSQRLTAAIAGGFDTTVIGSIDPQSYSPISIANANDLPVPPGYVSVGSAPNENEVTYRFADNLPDDYYRIEIFGFDDAANGIVALKNVALPGIPAGEFLPTDPNSRKDTIDFRLDLGPQVVSVVPQPVYRVNGQLLQQRDTIVVFFDNDKLLVENNTLGKPTARSAENPAFYQLILTQDSVRNTDDIYFTPLSAKYNATSNSVTLKFDRDIDILNGSASIENTWRLRVGTRESRPITPVSSEASATAITDLNTNSAVRMKFTSKLLGETGNGIRVNFINTKAGGAPVVTTNGNAITVDLRSTTTTALQVAQAIAQDSGANALVSVSLEGNRNTVVGTQPLSYSPVILYGLGSSFDTAMDLGRIGSSTTAQTSLLLTSNIDPQPFLLDLPGANDDPGHRTLAEEIGNGFEQHVNSDFGADRTAGITTVLYNFKFFYSRDAAGNNLENGITEKQRVRAREAFSLWSNYLGVQFIETADRGITVATGVPGGLQPVAGTTIRQETNFGVRIDPTFANPLLILDAARQWSDNYGEDWLRNAMAGIGMLLGLEHAGELPASTLMRMNAGFLNNADASIEPIFPGNFDILHGQYLFRPDGTDVDLYKFDVDFGGADRVGLFTAETFAERLATSSPLNTHLELYRQTQAVANSNLNAGEGLSLRFDAMKPGKLGNQLQIFVTKSDHGNSSGPIVQVFPNLITVDLNSRIGAQSTVKHFVDAINNNSAARQLVKVTVVTGSAATLVGDKNITYSPITLTGGKVELVAQNDDYYSEDSYLRQLLSSGTYYLGVSASGNNSYDSTIANTGFGGRTQGRYDLRVNYRAQVDTSDAIQDVAGGLLGDRSETIDGDGDGKPGGTYNFWFQTRPLDRVLEFNAGASTSLEGKIITITGATGVVRRFEFSSDPVVGLGNTIIPFKSNGTRGDLANSLASAINLRTELGVNAIANGARVALSGERLVQLASGLELLEVHGRTIFVDKAAGPQADGSLAKPFNNIAGSGVTNAFSVAQPGDIVRIVGNGGADNRLETLNDNFSYEVGYGLIGGGALSDGTSMDVPRGVTVMVDAGAIFKMRRSKIGVGSTNLNTDRSGGAMQVLGAPVLTDQNGKLLRTAAGAAPGSVYFTSWLDESVGFDNYAPRTVPAAGDWGGIQFRRDNDRASGKLDLEDQGIFLQYVNHADMRYGGGGNVLVDSIQQVVDPIHIVDYRPTVTHNRIFSSADAAMSAAPDSFEETNFHEPRFQLNGIFTSDYDRVGPEIHHNSLVNNSINGLFVRVETLAGTDVKPLSVAARFDDIDITHVVTENILIQGTPGGVVLDNTIPLSNSIATAPATGGTLTPGSYNYKISFVDKFGYETAPSDASNPVVLIAGRTAISIDGLPRLSGANVYKRIYRSDFLGAGVYKLVAQLNSDTTKFFDDGSDLGGFLKNDRPDVSGLSFARRNGGTLAAGTYDYRVVMIDTAGREGFASDRSAAFNLNTAGSIEINNLPLTARGYFGRRIYRSVAGGGYTLVAELMDTNNSTTTTFIDTGTTLGKTLSIFSLGTLRPQLDASLTVDPGTVVKMEGARIEIGFGAQLLAEGTDGLPVIFTSKLDDRYGAGGSFDTNNDGSRTTPAPRDWGGVYTSPTATFSLDHGVVAHAGGVTRLEGTFKAFNPVEANQANLRIANSTFEFNADGQGGQGPVERLGRLTNAPATLFLRGLQPILLNNIFVSNAGSAIDLDVNSMTDRFVGDTGRMTGAADRTDSLDTNYGPLIRGNRMALNGMNGLELRGDILTTRSIWDDTDIVHVLFDNVTVENLHHQGGLLLRSSTNESLVAKFQGYGSNFDTYAGTGLTATGVRNGDDDRVGGRIEVLGQPGFPVVLTSFHDDTVGAGLQPDGNPQTDTNGNGIGSIPRPADWRGILIDQNTHDRNVGTVLELEAPDAIAPGRNSTTSNAQFLGNLAQNASNSDENLRMGFIARGVLSQAEDVDTYSFTAAAGTEVWIDVDLTAMTSDMVVELLDAEGNLLARSDNSTSEIFSPNSIFRSPLINPLLVNPLPTRTVGVRTSSAGLVKEDGTTNPKDPGLRVVLPGNTGSRSTFYFRVRSSSINIENFNAGLTRGSYEAQLRMREAQEFAGSTVQFADIRYATNGVHTIGLPGDSPLTGEIQEDENAGAITSNSTPISGITGVRPQYVGNLLQSEQGRISIGGRLSNGDIDYYRLDLTNNGLLNQGGQQFQSVIFDMDYADGMNRPDTTLAIYEVSGGGFAESFQLVYVGTNSNLVDDRSAPLTPSDLTDLTRGSIGPNDPYIGNVLLKTGTYLVAVMPANRRPGEMSGPAVRREPVNSVIRIADDFIDGFGGSTAAAPIIPQLLDRTFVGTSVSPRNLWHVSNSQAGVAGHKGAATFSFESFAGGSITQTGGARGDLVSNAFDLGNYSAEDLPNFYFNYNLESTGSDSFDVLVRNSSGVETLLASNRPGAPTNLQAGGWQQAVGNLAGFGGQNGLRLVFRYNTNGTTANAGAGVHVDDLIIGFAERGETIINAPSGASDVGANVPANTILSGEYQLEIRKGEDFFVSDATGNVNLTKSFDTNDRASQSYTLIAPFGSDLEDGDTFKISDGATTINFEFTLDGSVGLGNAPIVFTKNDSDGLIARKMRDAINNPSIQSRLKVQAASSGGVTSGAAILGNRVQLIGNASGDFKVYSPKGLVIDRVSSDANLLRDTIFGTGINPTFPAVYSGGASSAALVSWGDDQGILLSNGDVNSGVGPNLSDNSSGLSTGTGDASTDAALGVVTQDATSLEMKFQFGNGTIGGDLYLDLIFASEEYNEAIGQDVLAVLIDGVNYALVPGSTDAINSSNINRTKNATRYVNNDPNDAGRFLNLFGFDGFTKTLSLKAAGIGTGEHTLKIVIADVGSTATDSAVFIRSRSVGTVPATRTWGGMEAIYQSGSADLNSNRDQSMVLIQNNTIRYSRDYGVWSEPRKRIADPRDSLAGSPLGTIMQARPNTVTTGGVVRNLRELNNDLRGGFAAGIIVANNVLESGGLGGVHIQGEMPIWMISPRFIPQTDPSFSTNLFGTHFGSFIDDRDVMVIDSGRNRVRYEFEDIAGGQPLVGGSGVVQGNGHNANNIPVYYRKDTGDFYLRITGDPPTPFGSTAIEAIHTLRDSILGSTHVTNGTTQSLTATVAASLLPPSQGLPSSIGYPNIFDRPALYLEGATMLWWLPVAGTNPWDIRQVISDTTQPFARVVNNTIYGNDGRASFDGDTVAAETNDTIDTAIETWQGTGHSPASYVVDGTIGDSAQFRASASEDVDIYKFKMNIGDRVQLDIDSLPDTLDSAIQIFDSQGRVQSFRDAQGISRTLSNNAPAPGEAAALDPYIDFTATTPGVYYVAVSGVGNTTYDPLSLSNRKPAATTGDYTISVTVLHPQQFTITAEAVTSYADGDTFQIAQIPDFAGTQVNTRTFEFSFDGGFTAGNVPIFLDPEYRVSDVARAIAGAINGNGANWPTPLPNAQQLSNTVVGGLASPLAPVSARALGGMSGVEPGLRLFPQRLDGFLPTHSSQGIGHDRLLSPGLLLNGAPTTSTGDGTTEKFVVVQNAAYIFSTGNIIVDPDFNENYNLDQILPETGIYASHGASPTLLNNVMVNVQSPIINEETRQFPNGLPAPFGTNINVHPKPGQVVAGGSIYQYVERAQAKNRLGEGIETGPTNIPNSGLDFNFEFTTGVDLFVDAQSSQFFPENFSRLIDSSLDSLAEREAFKTIKQAMGIAVSPVLAPSLDATGQLRVDDPTVAPPSGLGADVFKDRGALDRSDFVGPSAVSIIPIDNDAGNNDRDPSVSTIQLTSGSYPEFRIQLQDGFEEADPFPGIGIDDPSVVGPNVSGIRLPGTAVTVFENGRMLIEGFDYTFDYNATNNEIVLTPLAGVWKNDRVYEVKINNRDRYVISAPAGDQIIDGDGFTITDLDSGIVHFEFDSGYRLQLPQGLMIRVPVAGGGIGGVSDGERFSVFDGLTTATFELDRNNKVLAGNFPIAFTVNSTNDEIAQLIANAINNSPLNVSPRLLGNGRVFVGAPAGVRLNTSFSSLSQPNSTLALQVPPQGARPGGVTDGQFFTLNDGARAIVFEFDTDGITNAGTTVIDSSQASTPAEVALLILNAIQASSLAVSPSLVGNDLVYLGLPASGLVDVASSRLAVVGVSRTLTNGSTIDISFGAIKKTFEFTTDGVVGVGNIPVPFQNRDTQDEIGVRLADAIRSTNLNLDPIHLQDGNITIGGTDAHVISLVNSPNVSLFGDPGVSPSTTFEIVGSIVLKVPTRGGLDITDNSTFSLTGNNQTVVFEFDGNLSGPSQPGNQVIQYSSLSNANDIATSMAVVISGAGLGINAVNIGAGKVDLGLINESQVDLLDSELVIERGNVTDGEFFTLNDGVNSAIFEFENISASNGVIAGHIPILFDNASTRADVANAIAAAIEASIIGYQVEVQADGRVRLLDTPRSTSDIVFAPSLRSEGVPGGAMAIRFAQDSTFTADQVARSIVKALNSATNTVLAGSYRGGNTVFVENAAFIDPAFPNFFLRGVQDLAGNNLKANRINGETEFTILMPGVGLDYGDAPDPYTTTNGRYPTLHEHDGARHVVSAGSPILGRTIDADADGRPTPNAEGDGADDDGVKFVSPRNPTGVFNKNVFTDITVTVSSPGFVDGWIDFNADGDWDDAGEKVIDSVEFFANAKTRTFSIKVPASTPNPLIATEAFARFRIGADGGLLPAGLAVGGEVEDYPVMIVPGTPPMAINDRYEVNEDANPGLITTDASGNTTPSFTVDDGVAANDADPQGGPFVVTLISGPTSAANFVLKNDGTFTYKPLPNFFGTDTFTYQVSDGVLLSNNIGTATIVVREKNDAPIAGNDVVTIDEDQVKVFEPSQLLANDRPGPANESAQTLSIVRVQTPSARGGRVALVNGKVSYTPPTDFAGADQFTYVISDNGTTNGLADPLETTVTVSVTVQDKNDAPITVADQRSVVEDNVLNVTAASLIGNDRPGPTNESTQTLTFTGVEPASTNGGTVTFSNGTVSYRPRADFTGKDTFFYNVRDNGTSQGASDPQSARGTVTVTVSAVNDAPRLRTPFGTRTVLEDAVDQFIDLNTIFFDPDVASNGDKLTFVLVNNSNPNLVSATINAASLRLQLRPDRNGEAKITVDAKDNAGLVRRDTLTFRVTAVSDVPRLVAPIADVNVNEDAVKRTIQLSPTHFYDPDVITNGDVVVFTIVTNSNPSLVTPTLNNGSLVLEFAPDSFGISTLVIRATDNTGKTVQDSFDVNVAAVNDAPRTRPETYVVKQGATITAGDATGNSTVTTADNGVLANDTDVDSPSFTARVVRPPANGTLTFNGNGTFTYRPRGLQGTTDTFTYEAVDDKNLASVETTVTFQIDAPIPSSHQNPILAEDVNGDGFVSPIDALLIINFLNANGASTPISDIGPPPPFFDTDGSYFITPRDALLVINYLNTNGNGGGGEGEGEGTETGNINAAGLVWQINACRPSDNASVTLSEVVDYSTAKSAPIGPRLILAAQPGGSVFDNVLDELDSVIDDLSASGDEGSEQGLADIALLSLLGGDQR